MHLIQFLNRARTIRKPYARPAVVLAAVLALAACGGGKRATFTNPAYRGDFPDPFVLNVGDTYYAYATNGGGKQVQTLMSKDLVHWQPGPDALPRVGAWTYNGETWAPEVLRRDDGSYVLYYTATKCIGRAVAGKPLGPFVDDSKESLVCQATQGGSIDPSPFRDDDGKLYLLWKNDGNALAAPTYIYAQRLSPDGLHLVGKRTTIEKNDASWEASVVEGPMLRKHDGRYYLFYSGNVYSGAGYAVGYATCASPLGPCQDAPENPILETTCDAHGPGHNALIDDAAGRTWIVYHAWDAAYAKRQLWIDRLDWEDGKPVVEGPTCKAQDAPKP
jgi:beta-xylosidase